jgi:hypothetical protein
MAGLPTLRATCALHQIAGGAPQTGCHRTRPAGAGAAGGDRLKQALGAIRGVHDIQFNLLARSCVVAYDSATIPDAAWPDLLGGHRTAAAETLLGLFAAAAAPSHRTTCRKEKTPLFHSCHSSPAWLPAPPLFPRCAANAPGAQDEPAASAHCRSDAVRVAARSGLPCCAARRHPLRVFAAANRQGQEARRRRAATAAPGRPNG